MPRGTAAQSREQCVQGLSQNYWALKEVILPTPISLAMSKIGMRLSSSARAGQSYWWTSRIEQSFLHGSEVRYPCDIMRAQTWIDNIREMKVSVIQMQVIRYLKRL